MKGISSKTKIILLLGGFIVLTLFMFFFGYGIIAGKNQVTADDVSKRRITLEALQQEQKSFEDGKKDLAKLLVSTYPPDDLFSSDTKVVKEIQQLEEAAQRYNVDLKISVTGTTKDAEKVPGVATSLVTVPYNMTLNGSFANIQLFMASTEHLPFVTHAQNISVTVSTGDKTRAVISSEFFIKK